MRNWDWGAILVVPILIGFLGLVGYGLAAAERHERELIQSGACTRVLETLYTPAPTFHTSCTGSGQRQSCSTWSSQSDPYLRTLWRCGGEHPDEFWRRSERD